MRKIVIFALALLTLTSVTACDTVPQEATAQPPSAAAGVAQVANPVFQPYAQVSHSFTVPVDGTIQVPINTTDAASGIYVENDALVVPVDGCYFTMFAPQVGAVGAGFVSAFEAFMRVNGADVPNSNVLMHVSPDIKDVIVSQGVLCLDAGDAVTLHASASTPDVILEAITPPNGNPLVPAHITSMFYVSR